MREAKSYSVVNFSEEWKRRWHAGELGPNSYGAKTVIARMRRGKWVFIPPQWRGKVTDKQTIRKRASKHPHKQRRTRYGSRRLIVEKGADRMTVQERKAPTVDTELELV